MMDALRNVADDTIRSEFVAIALDESEILKLRREAMFCIWQSPGPKARADMEMLAKKQTGEARDYALGALKSWNSIRQSAGGFRQSWGIPW